MFQAHHRLSLRTRLIALPWLLIGVLLLIGAMGTATLYSVAGGSFDPWGGRHATRLALGLLLAVACAAVPVNVWRSAAAPIYIVALALLAAVPLIGNEALGARRWLLVAGVSIQPVEITKVALVLALAQLYATLGNATAPSRPHWVLLALAMIALPVALTVKQPDLGSGLLLAGVGLGLMFLAGVSLWYFLAGAAGLAALVPFAPTLLHDYQWRRIEVFLDPERDPLGAGYHIAQAKIALGAGGMFGQGYLKGTQSQLDFVPEKMTDFIFVAVAEEWGFAGAAAVLCAYTLAVVMTFVMALRANDTFARIAIGGLALSLSIYVVINVAMVTGLVPVVGVPLPLMSYGGTSIVTMMVALGVAMSAHVDRKIGAVRGRH